MSVCALRPPLHRWTAACWVASAMCLAATAGPAPPVPVSATHRNIALLVGVDQYQSREIRVLPHGCRNDVRAMSQVLHTRYKFTGLPSRPGGPIELVDAAATKDNILQALKLIARETRPGDQVLFYFSGYGSLDAEGKPTLCPHDALAHDAANDLRAGELYKWVHQDLKYRADNVILILDCSFAGSPAVAMGPRVRPRALSRPYALPPAAVPGLEATLSNVVRRKGVLLTACHPGQVARAVDLGDDQWSGIFSRFCTEQLRALPSGVQVSYRDLVDSLTPKIGRYVTQAFYSDAYRQTPAVFGRPEYVEQRGLFSAAAPAEAPPLPEQVRLYAAYYNAPEETRKALLDHLQPIPHVLLVASQEAADVSLMAYQSAEEVRGYFLDHSRSLVGEPFTAKPDAFEEFLKTVDERLNELVSYRWVPSVPAANPSLQLQFTIVDRDGAPRDTFRAGEEGWLRVSASEYCRLTLFALTSETHVRLFPSGDAESVPLEAGQLWARRFTVDKPGKYRFLALANQDEAVSAEEILAHVWEAVQPQAGGGAEAPPAEPEGAAPTGGAPPAAEDAAVPMAAAIDRTKFALAWVDVTLTE